MSDLNAIVDGTVPEATEKLGSLKLFELAMLRDLENAGAKRKTLLEAIDHEMASRDADTVEALDAELLAEYDRGRFARKNAIGREDSPNGKGPKRDAWQAGWDFQDKV